MATAAVPKAEVPEGFCSTFFYRGKCRFANCRFSHGLSGVKDTEAAAPLSRSTASAASGARVPDAASGGGRSGSWRSIDYLLRGESVCSNAYLREFAAAPWLQGLLDAPECSSLFNIRGKSLRKEISEAFGCVHACRRTLQKLAADCGMDDIMSRKIAVIDLCCGKGFGSLLLALTLPNAEVLAVDTNSKMELAHFRRQANLEFLELDVTRPDAASKLLAAAQAPEGAPLLFVGMHLCGNLSEHAARLFKEVDRPAGLVLAPCCLDGRQPAIKRRAKRLCVDPHAYWCMWLLINAFPLGPGHRRELLVDDDVLSVKNSFLIATSIGKAPSRPLLLSFGSRSAPRPGLVSSGH